VATTNFTGGVGVRYIGERLMAQSKTFIPVKAIKRMTKLRIISQGGRTHVEDEAGNRIWGVKSIKWEVDENDSPICTLVMYGVITDLEVAPNITVVPVHQGANPPLSKARFFPKKKKLIR